MKYFVVLSALVALTTALPVEMTLEQIDNALSNPNTDPALIPILEAALNHIMEALINGQQVDTVAVELPISVVPGMEDSSAPPASLVQVIVNVNKQTQQIHEIPAFVPAQSNPLPR